MSVGYPNLRFTDPRRQGVSPTPQTVGARLAQDNQQAMSPMTQSMAPVDDEATEGMPDDEAAEGELGGYAPRGAIGGSGRGLGMSDMPMMPQLPQRLPAAGMQGADYDPTVEHSASSTRVALERAVRVQMGKMVGSEQTAPPANSRELLARLGMPALELDLEMRNRGGA